MVQRLRENHRRSKDMPTVIVEADAGRTIDQKRGLVRDITEAVCKNYNVDPQAVTILLHEQEKENRAKGGVLIVDR
jgi:4-oxalocrotonate tautomerase